MTHTLPVKNGKSQTATHDEQQESLKQMLVQGVAKKKTDEAYAALEQHYRLVAEAIPQIVWTANPDGYVDYFNRRWFEYTGFTPEETYAGTKTAIHPNDREEYEQRWAESLSTGREYRIEYRFRRASDGQYRWHLGRAIPLRNGSGNIEKWFGTCTDIHDQKVAEEEVRRLNSELEDKVRQRTRELENQIALARELEERDRANLKRLQSVMDSITLGALMLSEDMVILHANERYTELLELDATPGALVGMKAKQVFDQVARKQENPNEYRQLMYRALSDLIPTTREVYLPSGRILSRDYVPIFVDGVHKGHLLLYRDITQEKRIDASKSEFMALASHQLRTPLTAIRWVFGKLTRMLQDATDDNTKYLLEEGRLATLRMASTIDTMLTISRIEAGKVNLKLVDTHARSLLEDIVEQFHAAAKAKRQKLTIQCPDSIFLVTDTGFLGEILRNLVSNAIKYSTENTEVLLIAREAGDGVEISVRDFGKGIPQEQQKNVFSKFFRGSNVVGDETNGTGLGLYLVHLLVTMLGGTISFTSTEQKGTTFSIVFPPVTPLYDAANSAAG